MNQNNLFDQEIGNSKSFANSSSNTVNNNGNIDTTSAMITSYTYSPQLGLKAIAETATAGIH